MKDVGISLNILQKDWAAWSKDMDEYNYDMNWVAWGASIFKNPEPSWHSKHKSIKQGQNYPGFSNSKVDEMIDSLDNIFEVNKRHDIVREIDKLIYAEVPYILLWNINYSRLLYWNKFGMPEHILGKYCDDLCVNLGEGGVIDYWWLDTDLETDLLEAIKTGESLPKPSDKVIFDEVYKP